MAKGRANLSEIWWYIFFGGLTTAVNFLMFFLLATLLGVEANAANIASVVAAICFAFYVNKVYVFKSRSFARAVVIKEGLAFVSARLISMGVEVGGFFVLYSLFGMNEYLAKFLISFFVVAINYFASKFLIFTHPRKRQE
jgi:Predicted membrane protein